METDASLSNFSWLTDALQQLFLARKCMAYRCGAALGCGPHRGLGACGCEGTARSGRCPSAYMG